MNVQITVGVSMHANVFERERARDSCVRAREREQ